MGTPLKTPKLKPIMVGDYRPLLFVRFDLFVFLILQIKKIKINRGNQREQNIAEK